VKSIYKNKFLVVLLSGMLVLAMASCGVAAPAISGVSSLLNSAPGTSQVVQPVNQVAAPAVEKAPAAELPPNEGVMALEGTLEQIYQQVNPSVVNIRVVQKVSAEDMGNMQMPFFNLPEGQNQSPDQYQSGLGSGFVWDSQGHIVTNNHVVEGADKIVVTFNDGTSLPADLVGTDPDSDLAVIKVDLPAGVQPLQLADSDSVNVGQLAVAIGNPFGLSGTMTMGIVSALDRSLPANMGIGPSYSIPDLIQTDAPINPGNSGGVLVDDQGLVVGVTFAIESSVGQSAGIGFAIPTAIVQKVVPTLISDGSYEHAWLGISGTSLVPELSDAMGLDENQRGVLVIDVMPSSPAEKAGLRNSSDQVEIDGQQLPIGGDVITAIDGQTVMDMEDLIAYLVGKTEVGQQVELTLLRDGNQETVSVTLMARPSADESTLAESGQQSQPEAAQGARLGIYGLDMDETIAQAMDLPADTQGILVEQVEAGSAADDAGLQGSDEPFTYQGQDISIGGDVITAIDGQSLSGIQELRYILSLMNPGRDVSLSVIRDGRTVEIPVTLGQ
jgi:S1-C subfamily serine protease